MRSSKTSGRRKLRRDQSSARLFCRGVPVSSNLLSVGNIFSSRTSRQLRFLILWPSSTIRYFHWKRWSRAQVTFLNYTDVTSQIRKGCFINSVSIDLSIICSSNIMCQVTNIIFKLLNPQHITHTHTLNILHTSGLNCQVKKIILF